MFVLVTLPGSTGSTESATNAPFSFADEFIGVAQPVEVELRGLTHPGEVVVAERWQPEFGESLTGVSMFRLVLLSSGYAPGSAEIDDERICVVAPGPASGRTGESKAVCTIEAVDRQNSAHIATLREVRRNYVAAKDPGLGRLASALASYESQMNDSRASDSHQMWKSGLVVTSASRASRLNSPTIRADELFLLSDPQSWVESAASVLDQSAFSERGESSSAGATDDSVEEMFEDLLRGRVSGCIERLREMCGIRIGESTPCDLIGAELERASATGTVQAEVLLELLVHKLGYPPAIASAWLVAFVLDSKAELRLTGSDGRIEYLNAGTFTEFDPDPLMAGRVVSLHSTRSSEWDAVLPVTRLVDPRANPVAFGGGRESDITEFELQLETLRDRFAQSTPVMLQLEVAAGATERPLTRDATRLGELLGSSSWSEYIASARRIFRTIAELRLCLTAASHHWAAIEYAGDIEKAVYYLDQVEFGRVDHSLAIEHRVIRSSFDLVALIENPQRWASLRDQFKKWRTDYRRAYLEDHAERRDRDRGFRERLAATETRISQIEQLDRIDALRLVADGSLEDQDADVVSTLTARCTEITSSLIVCDSDAAALQLVQGPACPNCRHRLGRVAGYEDVIELIAETDRMFDEYRDRLASIVSNLVLNTENSDRLQKLFRLNSAGDLSDLANVLNDKVISFLNELFGSTSGNIDDWTLPPS